MSEQEAFVACRCWTDGLATAPPADPETLELDRFGQLRPKGTSGMDEADELLWRWWESGACAHEDMREIQIIWWATPPGFGVIQQALQDGQCPALAQVLERGERFGAGTIIADAQLATSAYAELQTVLRDAGGEAKRHLMDAGHSFVELRDLLAAAVKTGNPLVGFYNGMSLGFAP